MALNHYPENEVRDGRRSVYYSEDCTCLVQASERLAGEYTVKDGTKSINYRAFARCHHLTKINLPESLVSIDAEAFATCDALTEIKLPKGLKRIGNSAFSGCTKLKYVELPEQVEYWGWNAFFYTPFDAELRELDSRGMSIHAGALLYIDRNVVPDVITEDFFPEDVVLVDVCELMRYKKVNKITFPERIVTLKGNFGADPEEIRFKSKVAFDDIFRYHGSMLKRVYCPKGTADYYRQKLQKYDPFGRPIECGREFIEE